MRRSQPSLPADPAWRRLHAQVRDAIADVGENLSGMVVVVPGHDPKNADDTTDAPQRTAVTVPTNNIGNDSEATIPPRSPRKPSTGRRRETAMINMDAVNREIMAAHTELESKDNVKGVLSLRTRTRIWTAILDPDNAHRSYRYRIELKIRCVRHVQHYWDRAFPGDKRVEEMISLAQGLVERQIDADAAERRCDRFLMDVYDKVENYNSITQPAVFVADGATHAVSSATHRTPEYDISDDTLDDDEFLPDSLETSYACASAAAGALNWQPLEETDVAARRAFWMWYLDEAIPAVLAS